MDASASGLVRYVRTYSSPSWFQPVREAVLDLYRGVAAREVWTAFAWDEIQNRYRRSTLGLAWLGLSYLLFVFGIALFFGGFSDLGDGAFVVHVAFGFAVYSLLLAMITDGAAVFSRTAGWVKSSTLPYSTYVFQSLARIAFPFCIQMVIAVLICPFFGWRPGLEALMCVPALLLIVLLCIPAKYSLGLLVARHRDIGHFIQAVSRLFFFTTPVLWVYEETIGPRRLAADLNPMTPFIELFRDPLLGNASTLSQWLSAFGWVMLSWATFLVIAGMLRRRLPFWV